MALFFRLRTRSASRSSEVAVGLRILPVLVSALLALVTTGAGLAEETYFFKLGTGPAGETRFALGGLIANALSNPPGSRPCEKGGSCGVPGMVAVASSTQGSIADIKAVAGHRLDAALVDADTAFWAVHGQGPFKGKPVTNLRGIALIYPQSLHLAVRHGIGIKTVRDLRGKRIALADGDQARGLAVLAAFGLSDKDVRTIPMRTDAAATALAKGQIDALLVADAWPISEVTELARTGTIDFLPLAGPETDGLVASAPYLRHGEIGSQAYQGLTAPLPTLTLAVVLVTSAEADPALIEGVTRALWHPSTRRLLADGNSHGHLVELDAEGLTALGLELHPGAAAYYSSVQR